VIEFEEHIYKDDPLIGHPDVRTRLRDAEYFFFGNGHINGAIQYSPSGEGSPFGLLVMDPDRLSMKRDALTMDPLCGLEKTALIITEKNKQSQFGKKGKIRWHPEAEVPTIEVSWHSAGISVTENFFCSDRSNPQFMREIVLQNHDEAERDIQIRTSVPGDDLVYCTGIPGNGSKRFDIVNFLDSQKTLHLEILSSKKTAETKYWENKAKVSSDNILVDRFFNASHYQLASMVSAEGRMDASIWQYNREWVRDHSFMCLGLIYTGHHDIAKKFLERLICQFVSEEGNTIDSSEKRHYDEVELDQNGELLYTINEYLKWTGDNDLIVKHKEKIIAITEYPLKPEFLDEQSGLLHNSREYWERHSIHGITDGYEFAYQIWVIIGLRAAASMAQKCGFGLPARWTNIAEKLQNSLLYNQQFSLTDDNHFIKRRTRKGKIERSIHPAGSESFPEGIPLMNPGDHLLNPDSSVSQAIVYGLIEPGSPLSRNTMNTLEELWSQTWEGGGYGRYNVTSEPDSPGPWPFPSLFIARAYQKMKKYDLTERVIKWLNQIPGGRAGAWFENYGERISPPYPQVGITPWTWAEMIMLVIKDIVGIEPEDNCVRIRPTLLPSMGYLVATIPVKGMIIDLKIIRSGKSGKSEEVILPVIHEKVSVIIEI